MGNPAGFDPILPLPKPPGHEQRQKNIRVPAPPGGQPKLYPPQRRVSFSELPINNVNDVVIGSSNKQQQRHQYHQRRHNVRRGPPPPGAASSSGQPRKRRSCCLTCCVCCAWTFLLLLILLLLLLLTGTLFYLWAQPKSPEFNVDRLTLSRYDLKAAADDDGLAYITTRFDLFVSASNRNDKIGFQYGPTKVLLISSASSSDDDNTTTTTTMQQLDVGRATIPGFVQGPNNLTVLKIRAGLTDSLLSSAQAHMLMHSFRRNNDRMLLTAALKGTIKITLGSWQSHSFDIKVNCNNIHAPSTSNNNNNNITNASTPIIDPRCEILLLGSHYVS